MIVSVPTELDNDHMEIMTLAAAHENSGGGDMWRLTSIKYKSK